MEYKIGDVVVIEKSGYGTAKEDIGLVCKIVDLNSKKSKLNYPVEIDKDKKGNNDRFVDGTNCLRLATSFEINQHYPTSLSISDLIEGEYYYYEPKNNNAQVIIKVLKNKEYILLAQNGEFYPKTSIRYCDSDLKLLRKATQAEIDKINKFISKDTIMKEENNIKWDGSLIGRKIKAKIDSPQYASDLKKDGIYTINIVNTSNFKIKEFPSFGFTIEIFNSNFELLPEEFTISYKLSDLKGKRYFIQLKSQQEWDNIVQFDYGTKKSTELSSYTDKICICFGEMHMGVSNRGYYENNKYKEIPYDKFIEANTSKIASNPSITKESLFNTRIWIGNNSNLNKKIQEVTSKLGFIFNTPSIKDTSHVSLYFYSDCSVCYSSTDDRYKNKSEYFDRQTDKREIFLKDLGIQEESERFIKSDYPYGNSNGFLDKFENSSEIVIKKVQKRVVNNTIQLTKVQNLNLNLPKPERKVVKKVVLNNFNISI